ncbi:MAG: hypothetical protein ACOCRX_04900 [Candidatus Woesearchaeota archaeon]
MKNIIVFTDDAKVVFDGNFSNVESYGRYQKNRIKKIIHRISQGIGILSYIDDNGVKKKIDLTKIRSVEFKEN